MSKEYVWSMTVDEETKPWICRVDESECVIIEDGQETQRVKIENPMKKVGVLQIDGKIGIYGTEVEFQLENGIPYIRMEGKWKMSETTMKDRQDKYMKNQMIGGMCQFLLGLGMCLGVLILYLITGSTGKWWFMAIMGSFMAIIGGIQWNTIRKEIMGKK